MPQVFRYTVATQLIRHYQFVVTAYLLEYRSLSTARRYVKAWHREMAAVDECSVGDGMEQAEGTLSQCQNVHVTTTDIFSGGGEMGALMRSLDWAATPLGPIEGWPQSLRTAISICLMSRFPMAVCWGAAYAILYNDAYRLILGTKHPWAMGRPCFEVWSELAHIVRPMFDEVIETGVATWSNDLMLPMLRHGYLEEAYFIVSYSAIRGETNRPEGIFVTVTETTERYLAERRLQLVRELGDAAGSVRSLEQAASLVGAILARHSADVPFSLLYMIDSAAGEAYLAAVTGVQHDHPAAPVRLSLATSEAHLWPLGSLLGGPEVLVVNDLTEAGALPGGIWPDPARTAILLPIPHPSGNNPLAVLIAGVNPRRALDERYHEFFRLIARQIANIMANAIAHEETRKRAETLAELDRAKTAFFSNVSHEFRTPLTLMLGPIEDVLAQSNGLSAKNRECLEIARRNSLRLLKLVNTLLDFAHIEAGRMQASYEQTDLAALTADLASSFRSAIEHAGLRFIVTCPPLLQPVYVDREMWEKIVLNLLSNAFKFTFTGQIEVALSQVGEMVELAVRDTGTGIPAEEIPHLFERFHRVKGARGRTFEGSGIGLALVQELVKLHGGTMHVKSEIDQGTIFTISIPTGSAHLPADRIAATHSQATTALRGEAYVEEAGWWLPTDRPETRILSATSIIEPQPENRNTSQGSATVVANRILLAEDNADMREYIRRLLSQKYDVVAVTDGATALQAAREQPFDLVLADVMMPHLDGFGLLAALRADERTKILPVILLSARAGEEARVEGMEAGADDYLIKPFSARELLVRVSTRLELARLRTQLEREQVALSNLFNQAPLPIAVLRGPDLIYDMANPAYLQVVGSRDILAKPLLEAFPEFKGQGFDELLRRVMQTGIAEVGHEALLKLERHGETEDTYWTFIYAPLHNTSGQIDSVIAICNEVTEQVRARQKLELLATQLAFELNEHKQAEAALWASERRYHDIFQSTGVSLWVEDFTEVKAVIERLRAQGVDDFGHYFTTHPDFVQQVIRMVKIVDVNDATLRMFGAQDKGELMESLHLIFVPETTQVFIGELLAMTEGRTSFAAETVLQTLQGECIHVLFTITFPRSAEMFDHVLVSLVDITERKRAEEDRDALFIRERDAREEAETLNQVSRMLAGQLDLQKLVQSVTDAGTKLTGAKFGAFFYNVVNQQGESYLLYTLSGAPREAFERFGLPRNTPVFEHTFSGRGVVRSDDILTHPNYGKNPPHCGMPRGHLPVRSYLAVPVVSRSGKVLGGLFFGHPETGIFTERMERIAVGIAAHAAIAIDNAHLFADAEREIAQRKQVEEKLRATNEELARFNRGMVDRELRMIELKKEVNELCRQQGQIARYPLEFEQDGKKNTPETSNRLEVLDQRSSNTSFNSGGDKL